MAKFKILSTFSKTIFTLLNSFYKTEFSKEGKLNFNNYCRKKVIYFI